MSLTRLILFLTASGLVLATVGPQMLGELLMPPPPPPLLPNFDTASIDSSAQAFAEDSFDFVIVGGGTAGLTVASRLAENPNVRVGVIEAGMYRPNDTAIDVPSSQGYIGNPDYDWGFTSTQQEGANNRSMYLARGKLVGGSSGINGLAWRRAAADDYDAWAEIIDDKSWSFNGLLPYFKKSENWTEPTILYPGQALTPALRSSQGSGGPIEVSSNGYLTELDIPIVSAAVNLGWDFNQSPNGGNSAGISPLARDVSPSLGVRFYSAPGYFAPNMQDSNLIVLTGAQATKINFSKIKGQIIASSVDFVVGDQQYTVKASKEVVLSAGQSPEDASTFGSIWRWECETAVLAWHSLHPRSSPGRRELAENNLDTKDHPLIAADFNVRPEFGTLDQMRFNSTFAAEAATEYATSRTGPMTYTFSFFAAVPLQSVVPASKTRSLLAELDAEIASTKLTPLQKVQYAYQRAAVAAGKVGTIGYSLVASGGLASAPGTNSSYLTLVAAAMQPFSRGSVHINSRNATLMTTIDVGYLKFGFDVDIVTAGLKGGGGTTRCAREGRRPPVSWSSISHVNVDQHRPVIENDLQPQCSNAVSVSERRGPQRICADALIPFNHVAGTTPMAPKQIGGVVDARLKVYGLQNVRIVDAGIFPMLVNAPLQPTVYAIAEKGADTIKAAWKL
ncbi:alcohol oxidase [Mycena latifolia]|nr:alcohol oxidase [Mycena latifolia]